VKLTLPIPVSANRYWRNFRGRMVISAEAKAYKAEVWGLAKEAGAQLMAGELSLTMIVYRPAKRGDLDNYTKILADSLQGVLYDNDSQIVRILAERHDDKHNPRVEVEISQVI
jgi:crossover junction endodeoxyribonuclease RusA